MNAYVAAYVYLLVALSLYLSLRRVLYRHTHRRTWYLWLARVREETTDQPREAKVLYFSLRYLTLHVRRLEEFQDGRFTRVLP